MSMIEIPDGDRTPIHFESAEILAVRDAGEGQTFIFLRGEEEGWKIKYETSLVLSLIPKRA